MELICEVDQLLSWLLLQHGCLDEAEAVARENYDRTRARIGDGWYVKSFRADLAATLIAQGALEESAELYGQYPTYPNPDREYDMIGSFNPDESELQLIVFWEE